MKSKWTTIRACLQQQFAQSFGRSMFRFCVIASPILYGFLLGMIYKDRSSADFVSYVIFGSGIMTFWSSICFSSASDIERERYMGTLETLFTAPAGFKTIILGKIIGNTLWGLLSMVISMVFVIVAFNRTLVMPNLWIVIPTFILMTLSFIAIALAMAGMFTLSRNSRLVMNCLEHSIFFICGLVFPVELLPRILQPISYLLSPTWAVKLFRLSTINSDPVTVLSYFGGLIVLTIVYWIIGIRLFKKIDYKARVEATLGVY